MDYFKTLFDQFRSFWKQTSPVSRFGIVATVLFCLAMIIGVGYWASQPHYVTVATDLNPDKAAELVDALEKKGIDAKFNYLGTGVLVDESKLARARAIIKEVDPGIEIADTSDSGWFKTQEDRRESRHRNLEVRLAKTIMRLRPVEHAAVHIHVAKSSRIESMQQDSTASVVIKLRPGAKLSGIQGNSIVAIVASGVPGLEPKNVSVVDTEGRDYSPSESVFGQGVDKVSLRRDHERYLKFKVESMLTQMLGPGKASVMVTAQVDFKRKESKSKQITPEGKVTKSEKRKIETEKGRPSNVGGVAGVSANSTNGNATTAKAETIRQKEESEITSEFPVVVTTESEVPDWIKRLSVAAVVDLTPEEGEQPRDIAGIESLIKSAIGFDETRGDTIKVVNSKMTGSLFTEDPTEIPTPVNTEFILNIVRQSSLALGAIFAFAIGFLMIRKIKPITVKEPEIQISPERSKHLADLSIVAKENPELLAKIVAAWINETPLESSGDAQTTALEKRAA